MAFKLEKAEVRLRTKLLANLSESGAILTKEVERFNQAMTTAWAQVEEAQAAHNKQVAEAQAYIESVHERVIAEYEAETEDWQEGEIGQAVSSWLDEWSVTLDDSDIEVPEPVEVGELAGSELEALPDEPT